MEKTHCSSSSGNNVTGVNDDGDVDVLHVMFLPFVSPGHMIPLVDMAKIMASHSGVRATVVTTAGNASAIKPSIEGSADIDLATLPSFTGPAENMISLPTPQPTPEFMAAVEALQPHFEHLVRVHRPDCIIADTFFPWANDVAAGFGIPRIAFQVSGSFPSMAMGIVRHFKPYEGVTDDDEPFLVPMLPHPISFTKSQLTDYSSSDGYWTEYVDKMGASVHSCYGNVLNSFYELEPEYADMMRAAIPNKVWHVGPVSLCSQHRQQRRTYDVDSNNNSQSLQQQQPQHDCLSWLDKKPQGSVVYVCFGTLGQFTSAQLREMAAGLESCGHPFIWVIRADSNGDYDEAAPAATTSEKCMIVRGWVPQVAVLAHPAVGGFVTHCGWNSFLEGVSAGVPTVTWPLFAEQFADEKLTVDVLKTGVAVGSKKWSNVKEERTLVRAAELRAAVEEVMGEGEEASKRRARAKKVAEMARAAVAEGGSSHGDMMRMIQDLKDAKLARIIKSE